MFVDRFSWWYLVVVEVVWSAAWSTTFKVYIVEK